MKSENECELLAHKSVQDYVNSCQPSSVDDIKNCLYKLLAVTSHAVEVVESGKMETVQ
jgi:hypothetical protein